MTYAYVALDASGRKRTGTVDAASQDAAMQTIQNDGRFVLQIAEERRSAAKRESTRKGKVSRTDLALFSRRLADLSGAGLPLDRVISVIGEQSESDTLAEICNEVLQEVRGGKPVSEALAMHPKYFNQIFCQTLRAGEASGQFPEVAQRLAGFQENEVARRSQIISSLIYPAILAVTAVGVIIVLLTFVVPRLSPIFKGLGSDLPASTKLLLASTTFLTSDYVPILITLAALVLGYRFWIRTDAGAMTRDRFYLQAPVLGPVIRKATVSRFSRILGTLLYGGVPILQALELAGLASGNRVFQASSELVENDVREGQAIAGAMKDAGAFPPVLINMVAVGEETGNLPLMLARVSDSLDFEVDNGMRRLTAMVEPIIVLVMGSFVGFVVISVLLPIYQAGEVIK
ncbi:MAG: type II secretion system F family protein [Fimbriimonadaceae bacterium]